MGRQWRVRTSEILQSDLEGPLDYSQDLNTAVTSSIHARYPT